MDICNKAHLCHFICLICLCCCSQCTPRGSIKSHLILKLCTRHHNVYFETFTSEAMFHSINASDLMSIHAVLKENEKKNRISKPNLVKYERTSTFMRLRLQCFCFSSVYCCVVLHPWLKCFTQRLILHCYSQSNFLISTFSCCKSHLYLRTD